MGRLAGYMRVSAVGNRMNAPGRFHSPDEQAEEIGGWAKRHKHKVDLLEPELDGKGSNPNRPILREAVEGIKAGRWDGVVVAYLSRAGRDLRLMLDLWDEVEAKEVGGVVYFARENIDGSTPHGRMQRNILASVAQYELEERRDGFERATKGAVEAGIWQRRQVPRGYLKNPETRGLEVVDGQAEEVRRAARDLLGGKPVVQIAREIGMTPGGVRAMLRNRVYLGELKVRSYVKLKAHEAILDPETFEAVQQHLDRAPRPGRNPSKERALLAGLIRCQSCGHVMTSGTGKGGAWMYKCPTHHSGRRCPRPVHVSKKRIDAHVEEIAVAELERLRVSARSGNEVASARAALSAAEGELASYLEATEMAGIGPVEAAVGMRSRKEKVEEAEDRLRAEMARVPRLPTIEGGADLWPDLTADERNELLRSLLAAVIVRPVGTGNIVPIADRTRVLRHGAEIVLPGGRRGQAAGIIPLVWPDADGIDVLRISSGEDSLEGTGSVCEM